MWRAENNYFAAARDSVAGALHAGARGACGAVVAARDSGAGALQAACGAHAALLARRVYGGVGGARGRRRRAAGRVRGACGAAGAARFCRRGALRLRRRRAAAPVRCTCVGVVRCRHGSYTAELAAHGSAAGAPQLGALRAYAQIAAARFCRFPARRLRRWRVARFSRGGAGGRADACLRGSRLFKRPPRTPIRTP